MVDLLIGIGGSAVLISLVVLSMCRIAALSDAQEEREFKQEVERCRK